MNAIVAQTIRQHATPHNVFGHAEALSFFRDCLFIIAMVVPAREPLDGFATFENLCNSFILSRKFLMESAVGFSGSFEITAGEKLSG